LKAVARKIFGGRVKYKYVILCNKMWNSNYLTLFQKKIRGGVWTLNPPRNGLVDMTLCYPTKTFKVKTLLYLVQTTSVPSHKYL